MTAPKRRWFQFSTRDLLLSMTVVAIGIAGIVGTLRRADSVRDIPLSLVFGLVYGSGAIIGAGLFSPLKKTALGAVVGFLTACALTTALEIFRRYPF